MKICISEFTYNSFEELLENNFKNDEFILIDSEANIISGEGKPDIALVSYELMFKALKSESFFEKYLALIDECSFVQGSWAGTCLLYTSSSPRDLSTSRMPSSA